MRKIPPKLLKEILDDPYYQKCARHKDGNCSRKITLEHAIIFAGRQLNEKWAILPMCTYHHAVNEHQDGGELDKNKNIYLALCRASPQELKAISKAVDYQAMRERLKKVYG